MSDISTAITSALKKSFTFQEFQEKMAALVKTNKSSGVQQSDDLANYTKLNKSRIKRLAKTQTLNTAIEETLKKVDQKLNFIVLTESWCGDAAQTVPVIDKVAEASENINLRVAYRDENQDLMQEFLTNGNQAIPKLIIVDEQNNVIADWGPRPTTATKMVNDYKEAHGGLDAEFKENLQIWYNNDKGEDTLNDLNNLLVGLQK